MGRKSPNASREKRRFLHSETPFAHFGRILGFWATLERAILEALKSSAPLGGGGPETLLFPTKNR